LLLLSVQIGSEGSSKKKKQIQVFDGEALYALKGVAGSTYVMFQSSH
jgi:hypothetical protein